MCPINTNLLDGLSGVDGAAGAYLRVMHCWGVCTMCMQSVALVVKIHDIGILMTVLKRAPAVFPLSLFISDSFHFYSDKCLPLTVKIVVQ